MFRKYLRTRRVAGAAEGDLIETSSEFRKDSFQFRGVVGLTRSVRKRGLHIPETGWNSIVHRVGIAYGWGVCPIPGRAAIVLAPPVFHIFRAGVVPGTLDECGGHIRVDELTHGELRDNVPPRRAMTAHAHLGKAVIALD